MINVACVDTDSRRFERLRRKGRDCPSCGAAETEKLIFPGFCAEGKRLVPDGYSTKTNPGDLFGEFQPGA